MRKIRVFATTVFLSIFLVVAVNAAPKNATAPAEVPQGIQNLKRVMQTKIAQDKKMHVKQGTGQNKKKQAAQSVK